MNAKCYRCRKRFECPGTWALVVDCYEDTFERVKMVDQDENRKNRESPSTESESERR